MELTTTIDTTFADLSATVDRSAGMVAERIPAPVDALVLRVGAINAEAIRQTGRVYVTSLEAMRDVATVAWTGSAQLIDATGDAVEASAGTVRDTGRRALGDARRATSTIKNRAGKAADQVDRDLGVVAERADEVENRVAAEAGAAADKVVKATDTGVAETGRTGAGRPSGPYESWTKEELYERAQELDIDGRSTMSKNQLVKALRSA